MPLRTSQGASTAHATVPPISMLAADRSPIIAPVPSSTGLQLKPSVRLAAVKPPSDSADRRHLRDERGTPVAEPGDQHRERRRREQDVARGETPTRGRRGWSR